MKISQVVQFHADRFFEGAVQLSWVQRRKDHARQAAAAFVFHGPKFHGAADAEKDGIEGAYRLKDTASFVMELLESMLAGASGREVNPYWLAVAGYGSGKSHLALTAATLLADPCGETARAILEQISKVDGEIGNRVARQLATLKKPALVIALDGMSGFHLGSAMSQAVFARLREDGVDPAAIRALSPRFETAAQFVERNFTVRQAQFEKQLPGVDAAMICSRLDENDEITYSAVDAVYLEANGHTIPIEGQESAQELINTLCNYYCGPDGAYSHVIILFDELGRYLEYAADKPQLAGDYALQQIFQGVQDNSTRIRFVGFIQYELKAYLKRFGGADLRQLQRYITRFDSAEKWYLSTNLETIFAHMIGKRDEHLGELWLKANADVEVQRTWDVLSGTLPGFRNFPVWAERDRFGSNIAYGCWPLHPFAVWFLTRQRDLVQSRSALTFIKDVLARIANEDALAGGALRWVSAAELAMGDMLPELVAAERETGGSIAETLQMLLEKFSGHLDRELQLVLGGIAVLERTRIGRQTRDAALALLGQATAMAPADVDICLDRLAEIGAVEWNADLGQFELLSDGATRGQFQQWLRGQLALGGSEDARNLFVRRGAADCDLKDVIPDFAHTRHIATPDWYFEARLSHANIVENVIRGAFREWVVATAPKDPKGKLIYLYVHPDDDFAVVEKQVKAAMAAELRELRQPRAPIFVVGIVDADGSVGDFLARLNVLEDGIAATERERFRRFVPQERARVAAALKERVQDLIKARTYWVAGFKKAPEGRLRSAGLAVFSDTYPNAIPFPFDGFATAAGGGAADAAQLSRALIARQVNGPWVQAQPKRMQNRVDALLVQSWGAFSPVGRLVAPAAQNVRDIVAALESLHMADAARTLRDSYRMLLAPPYGMNASSAAMLLGVMLGLDSPPRRIERCGRMVSSADWLGDVFPSQRGQHYLDEDVLAESRVRFLAEDSVGRWRALLEKWELETKYGAILQMYGEAEDMAEVDPLPESLLGSYGYLRDRADGVREKLAAMDRAIEEWQRGLEGAERRPSVHHSLKLGSQIKAKLSEIVESGLWPDRYAENCDNLLCLARAQVARDIAEWIPRQMCQTAMQVAEFRKDTEREAAWLRDLGFTDESKALTKQALLTISRIDKLQAHSLTLAQANDYPNQPAPTDSTQVRWLRDEMQRGAELVAAVKGAAGALDGEAIKAIVAAIESRKKKLEDAVKRQERALGGLYEMNCNEPGELAEMLVRARRLREIFVGTPDEGDINGLIVQLEKALVDVASWGSEDLSPESLEDLLDQQISTQEASMSGMLEERNLDPAWDWGEVYRGLGRKRVLIARQRSEDWIASRAALAKGIDTATKQRCQGFERDLLDAPGYLAAEHVARVKELLARVEGRIAKVTESERHQKFVNWAKEFPGPGDVRIAESGKHELEELLNRLESPPCALTLDEKEQMAPLRAIVLACLDRLSMEELFGRIDRLSSEQKMRLLEWLTKRVGEP